VRQPQAGAIQPVQVRPKLRSSVRLEKVLQIFSTFGFLAGLLFIAIGVGIGWLLGGAGVGTKRVVALGTGQPNIAAAIVELIFLMRFLVR